MDTGRMFALVAMSLIVAACGPFGPTVTPPAAAACAPQIETGVLPDWARAGFSEAEPTARHAIGRSGEILGILFGGTLLSPPNPEISNKILWVARDPVATPGLVIAAQRMDGSLPVGDPVERSVPDGPGPSTVDLPEAGCWRFTLTWDDQTDTLDLEYEAPPSSAESPAAP